MSLVFAVVNQKGGVGKTTTTVSLGAALAGRGQRTLIIDADPHMLRPRAGSLLQGVEQALADVVGEQFRRGVGHGQQGAVVAREQPAAVAKSCFHCALVDADVNHVFRGVCRLHDGRLR